VLVLGAAVGASVASAAALVGAAVAAEAFSFCVLDEQAESIPTSSKTANIGANLLNTLIIIPIPFSIFLVNSLAWISLGWYNLPSCKEYNRRI
jgi:hypothetical protein